MTGPRILIMAKSPLPGMVKTRLCPAVDPAQAAELAEAALRDTLSAAASASAVPILALEGPPGDWLLPGIRLLRQRGAGLDERIAHAVADVGAPVLVIGSDTPQLTTALLDSALAELGRAHVDAVLGPAVDGGWWALGLGRPDPAAIVGVPMSTSRTGRAQLLRLRSLGLRVRSLPVLRDVDTISDAWIVAGQVPESEFAAAFRRVRATQIPANAEVVAR